MEVKKMKPEIIDFEGTTIRVLSKRRFPEYKETTRNHVFHNGHFKESYRKDEFSYLDFGACWIVGLAEDIATLQNQGNKGIREILVELGVTDCYDGVCKLEDKWIEYSTGVNTNYWCNSGYGNVDA